MPSEADVCLFRALTSAVSQPVPHDVFGHGIRGPTTAPYDPLGRHLASAGLFSRTLPHEAFALTEHDPLGRLLASAVPFGHLLPHKARAAPSTLRRASLVRLRLRHGVCPAPHRSLQDDACAGERGGGRARLLGFIWQTRNDGQNWIRKPNPLFRSTREKKNKRKIHI